MATIKEDAQAYEPNQMKNIADLEVVSVDQTITEEDRKNSSGEEYTIAFITLNNFEYRVPNSVREQLKEILKEKPELKTFKVSKTGEGLKTSYTVIPLE